ncbi:LytR/AlgR family response regulator transcription factor [Xylocopilactobacillus apicola]|uniref:DNA-binding response regulator n=1 Tax=Xylocopilactobacillus apicola TaxID=2932184 RepID=A0AAU9D2W7_9LACO|nr:LytTR family transcriptional regulator DNA-binding domain-containing protein [Xylocopilactobacillus apicola]BDR59151.1 DNA-binding response regulator [Xylocopilactobacillus apicola]
MLKIFVCDDQEIHLKNTSKIINDLILFIDMPMKIELATTKPAELISKLDSRIYENDIYFLDIDLNDETYDGLKLAVKIREYDPHGFIIFITSHLEFGMLTFEYKIGAFDYIVKTDDWQAFKEKIGKALNTIAVRYQTEQSNLEKRNDLKLMNFVSDYDTKQIDVDDIVSLEVVGNHKILVTGKYHIFRCNGSLSKIFNNLPEYFLKCNRSSIVNLKEVKGRSVKDETIIMSDGSVIRCSKWQQNKFKDTLNKLNILNFR